MARIALILLATTCAFALRPHRTAAQDAESVVLAMLEAHRSSERFSVAVKMSVYAGADQQLVQRQQLTMRRSGRAFLHSTASMTFFSNGRESILVNHRDSSIVYDRGAPDARESVNGISEAVLREQLQRADSIVFIESTPFGEHYAAFSSAARIPRMDLFIDPTTHLLQRVSYEFPALGTVEPSRVDLQYSWDMHPTWTDQRLTLDHYVKVEDGSPARVSSAYRGYELRGVEVHED